MSAYAVITGRLGVEPELRFTNSGTPVINLSIANNRSVKVGDKRESVADWFKVTIFGRDAEIINQYAKKGSALAFNGRLQNEKYVDRDGNQRTSTILVASSFEFVPTAKRDGGNTDGVTENDAGVEAAAGNETDDDIPF
ncbi:MAG: single-stranded DNA-binding protein [Acidobacteria bacterium]|nr:single-stranded DNA-binding protein [Acidobacteriota bacterium]